MRDTIRQGLIFAAGFGTRMGALTENAPKPLLELGEKTLLDRAIDTMTRAGITQLAVNAHYRHEMISRHLHGQPIAVLTELPDILDTGGGLKNARRLLGDRHIVTLNPDGLWLGQNPVEVLLRSWSASSMGALLLLTPLAKAQARSAPGDIRMDGDGRIALGGDLVYTGVQIIDAALADEIEEETFSMHRLWDLCAARGGLFGAVYDGGWCDVGTAKGLSRAEELIRENSV